MLALKLTLVPLCLLLVSMSGKWWGPGIAGWLAGLPWITGPILFLITLEQGPIFGALAAALSLSAILASEAFNLAYAWSCRSQRWPLSVAAALATWLVVATGLSLLPATPAYGLGVALFAVILGQSFLPKGDAVAKGIPLTKIDLVGRMLAGAALTLLVTAASSAVGPKWSGLLAVFPLFGTVLCVSSHRAYGPHFVASLLRGMVLGRFSFAAFCLCLTVALPQQTIAMAFTEATILAVLVQYATKRLTARL